MIDYIKAALPKSARKTLLSNPCLEFISTVSNTTGEEGHRKEAKYHGLKFIVYNSGYTELQGSLHKYRNGGVHNADDFHRQELIVAINELSSLFNFNLLSCKLSNLEFGVNIRPPVSIGDILDNLLFHRMTPFEYFSVGGNGLFKQAKNQRKLIKAYDKGIQYKSQRITDKAVLRFELKFVKMYDLLHLGVDTINSLVNTDVLRSLGVLLSEAWDQSFLYDITIDETVVSQYYRNMLAKWQLPHYWLRQLTKEERYKQKCIYKSFVESHSQDIHGMIRELIVYKWDQLSTYTPK